MAKRRPKKQDPFKLRPRDSQGKLLARARAELGVSSRTIAALCGVSHATVLNWEADVHRVQHVGKVAEAYCVSFDELAVAIARGQQQTLRGVK